MKKIIISAITATIMIACSSPELRQADIEGIDMDFHITRFDSIFWNIDTTCIKQEFLKLDSLHPEITRIYIERVMMMGAIDSPRASVEYINFRKYPAVIDVYTSTQEAYTDISDIEEELKPALLRATKFLPNLKLSKFYTHISFFNQNIIVGQGFISLSIDNYMGEDYSFYDSIGIYSYLKRNMIREKIPCDYLTAMLCSEYMTKPNGNLLDDMIYYGKILYTVWCLLPDEKESTIMGYTEEQMNWAKERESSLWQQMVETHIIFSENIMDKTKYLNDGPFTQPFGQDSPDRLGAYIGWKIVRSYMKNNQDVSIMQLLQEHDGQKILNKSNYR